MDLFINYLKTYWKISDLQKIDTNLSDFNEICRICFTTTEISPIEEMEYKDISMITIMETCLSLQLDLLDILPNKICSGCTKQLLQFYMFRENCKISELALLLAKDKLLNLANDNIDTTVVEDNYSDNEDSYSDNEDVKSNPRLLSKVKQSTKTKAIRKQSRYNVDNPAIIRIGTKKLKNSHGDKPKTELPRKRIRKRETSNYSRKFKCVQCNMVFGEKDLWREHCKKEGHLTVMKKIICEICGKMTPSVSKNEQHMLTHNKEKPHLCDQCPAAFSLVGNLTRHKMIHSGEKPYVCSYCGFACNQKVALDLHIANKHETDNPDLKRMREIRADKMRIKRKPFTPYTQYKCDECERIFKRQGNFDAHKQKHNELKLKFSINDNDNILVDENHKNSLNNSEITTNKLSEVIIDDKLLQNNVTAVTNSSTETSDQTYTCKICDNSFKSNLKLKTHLLIHGAKKYFCRDCDRGFTTTTALSSHTKVHTREKPYSCRECGKHFAHLNSLNVHLNMHAGVKPYRCDVCGKQFTQASHLTYHLLLHTGEKSHVCSYCNRAFTLKGNLTVHMRTHTGETPYKCDVCERGFYDSSSRKRHRKGHTVEEIRKAEEVNQEEGKCEVAVISGE